MGYFYNDLALQRQSLYVLTFMSSGPDQHILEFPSPETSVLVTQVVVWQVHDFGTNSLPYELRILSSHTVFKSKLKTLLNNDYYCRM